jgi:hypothetical protein
LFRASTDCLRFPMSMHMDGRVKPGHDDKMLISPDTKG